MLCTISSLAGTDAFFVVLEGKVSRAADGCKLSAILPRERVAQTVVIAQRIADGIIVPHRQAERKLCLLSVSTLLIFQPFH